MKDKIISLDDFLTLQYRLEKQNSYDLSSPEFHMCKNHAWGQCRLSNDSAIELYLRDIYRMFVRPPTRRMKSCGNWARARKLQFQLNC
jgi:hypothetical protein